MRYAWRGFLIAAATLAVLSAGLDAQGQCAGACGPAQGQWQVRARYGPNGYAYHERFRLFGGLFRCKAAPAACGTPVAYPWATACPTPQTPFGPPPPPSKATPAPQFAPVAPAVPAKATVPDPPPIPVLPAPGLGLLNGLRAAHGLAPVYGDPNMAVWAQRNVAAMETFGLGHFVNHGYYQCAGQGYPSAEAAMHAWYNSSGHRALILSPGVRYAGLAWSGTNWTLNLR